MLLELSRNTRLIPSQRLLLLKCSQGGVNKSAKSTLYSYKDDLQCLLTFLATTGNKIAAKVERGGFEIESTAILEGPKQSKDR